MKAERSMDEEGKEKIRMQRSEVVWSRIGLVPCHLELRVRRLKWMQAVSRDPSNNEQVLSAMFSQLYMEDAPTVREDGTLNMDMASPWAVQWKEDLLSLGGWDDGEAFLELIKVEEDIDVLAVLRGGEEAE
eukprot:9132549-Lingulodinium_polyedra.AAC.1